MRKPIVLAVVLATLTGLAGASVAVAPVAVAHAGHQISIADKAAPEGSTSGDVPPTTPGTMTISLSLAPQANESIVVPWSTNEIGNPGPETAEGGPTATFPDDFQNTSGQVTFNANETSKTITIPITADQADELDERFVVNLGTPLCAPDTCSVIDGEGIYTIQDDDAPATISINDVGENEGNDGAPNLFEFTVTRSPGSHTASTVHWATADGTATDANNDYEPGMSPRVPNRPISFAASHGPSTSTVRVVVNGDNAIEPDEHFFVNLSDETGLPVSRRTGTGTITNDDAVGRAMTISDATATEGGALTFTVTLSSPPGPGGQARVDYSTQNGTATAPADYTAQQNQTLIFSQNQTTKQISVATTQDTVEEDPETMFVDLVKPEGCCTPGSSYTIVDGQNPEATGTINDDDKPSLQILNDPTVVEGDPGENKTLTFTVRKSGTPANGQPVTVKFTTEPNTAAENVDYLPKEQDLTFPASPQVDDQNVTVEVNEDFSEENNETFFGKLSNAGNGFITDGPGTARSDGRGTATISDDDGTPTDFNGDGFDDQAFGVPGEDLGSKKNAGSVNVIYGSANRLRASAPQDQLWSLDSSGVQGIAAANDRFGAAMAEGNFNGDNFADLAVALPGASGGAGAVSVLYGSASGLTSSGNQLLSQSFLEVEEDPEPGDAFGFALTADDFNGDGRSDLAIGVPGEAVGADDDAGAVNVLYGSVSGLTATAPADQLWHQDNDGIAADDAEAGDGFGRTLASGNLNGDGFADLVAGAPTEDLAAADAGALTLLLGSAAGVTATGSQFWNQGDNADAVEDQAEAGDAFALAVAVGDVNGDGTDDLAVGVPLEDNGGTDAGAVNVLFGSTPTGLVSAGDQFWTQDSPGIADSTQAGDRYGAALVAADFDNDGREDLAIGVPREDYSGGTKINAGVVNVLYGTITGLAAANDQLWHPDVAGVRGAGESGDFVGAALATGDFNDNNSLDLVISAHGEDLGSSRKNAGSSHVLYGSAAKLTANGDQVWNQETAGVRGSGEKDDLFAQDVA